jgi:hypothetical protein
VDLTNIGLGSIGGASGTGVQFGAAPANCALCNPSDTTQTQAIQTIANSVSPVLNGLNSLTGNKLAGWNATNLADFLVNQAISHGLTDAQIQQAATQIAQNIGAATPIINAATSGNSYTNNTTNLTLRAASFEELAMGYSHALPIPGLLVGGNIKIIEGLVGFDQYKVMNNGSNNDALSNLTSNIAKSVQPGLDLGVLWKADKLFPVLPFNPRLGIVGRNLNNPKFDQPAAAVANGDASRYAENGQIRMGVALSPTHFWNITADMDLTNNLTPVDGYHSRLVGLGTEVNVFNRRWINIPLRAGIMRNIEDPNYGLAYTAGLGVNLAHLMFDVAGQIGSRTTQIQPGQQGVPSEAGVSAQLSFMFGGDSQRTRKARGY